MKLRHYLIFSLITVLISSATGAGGYFIALKKAELDKEAAVKGAIYDAKEQLSREAIEQAKKTITQSDLEPKAIETINVFFNALKENNATKAWDQLTTDYKKTIYSINSIKKYFLNIKDIRVTNTEFRTSGNSTLLYAIDIEKTQSQDKTTSERFYMRLKYYPEGDKLGCKCPGWQK